MASRGVWHAGLAGDAPRSLGPAIARGLAWEGRILPSREVSIVGNTRANGVMQDHNAPKAGRLPDGRQRVGLVGTGPPDPGRRRRRGASFRLG